MTIEEAKLAVKEALNTGPKEAVKAALLEYYMVKKNEEEEANAIYKAAVEIFNPNVGQLQLQ